MPSAPTDVLLELKQFNVHDCAMDLPFALALLKLVGVAQTGIDKDQKYSKAISDFKETVSQCCSVPLPYTIGSIAIKATRLLGYRYLWINSACIIQDSPGNLDWARESPWMD